MKTANLAIVFTDIKGFTERTSRQTLEQNERLLATHARLLKPLFESFGGRIIKSIGDAFMVTFESPTQAVLCGAAIQDRLWLHNREAAEGERFDVRIGMNVGEVRVENNDVFGEPVNIASRVEGIANPGEVYFTEAVYLSMNKAEVPSEEVGNFELKGIPGQIKVFRVPHAPYRMAAPAQAASAGALPPFGNLGLSRVKDEPLGAAVSSLMERARGAELGGKARGVLAQLRSGQRPAWLKPRLLAAAGVAVLVVVALAIGLGSSEVESAIDEVASAPERERSRRVEHAEALIARLKDAEERAFYKGYLEEARGDLTGAIGEYGQAVRLGSSRGEKRLRSFLEHPKCTVRTAAVSRIASLKLTSARGELEDLAEDGGPDDEGGEGMIGAIFGCNSKDAAARALKQLE